MNSVHLTPFLSFLFTSLRKSYALYRLGSYKHYQNFVIQFQFKHLLLFSSPVVSDSLQPHDCNTPGFLVLHLSLSLLKLMSTEVVMPSNRLLFGHALSSCPQSFPGSGYFPMSQFFHQVAKVLEFQL